MYARQDALWAGPPPTRSTAPQLYDGLVPRRCIAYFLDVLAIAAIGLCISFVLMIMGILTFGLMTPLAAIILAAWPLAYHSLFLAMRGATPGMRLLGLQCRTWDGLPITGLQAVVVTVLFYATVGLTAWLILLVALFNERGRTLHDVLANTLIVRSSG